MSRLIDLSGDTIWISFKFEAGVLATVKSIRGRKYDPETKRWSLPVEQLDEVVRKLEPLHFKFTPRLREKWIATRDEAPPETDEPAAERDEVAEDAFSVSRLNAAVRAVVTANFSQVVLLEGELSGYDRNRPAGHAYFELVERVASGTDPIARVSAVCFAKSRASVVGKLRRLGISLKDGQRVRFYVRPELYTTGGRFQVIVEGVDTEFLVDEAVRRRDVVVAELRRLGVLDDNLNVPFPACPLRIGLVTASGTDGYNDFVHELTASGYAFEIKHHPARMQGLEAGESISKAIRSLDRADLDLIAVVRGGGAKLSLADLDDLEIGLAVCRAKTKVLCGIGHHRDEGVLDLIATSAKTPTAAAQKIVRALDACMATLSTLEQRLVHSAQRSVDDVGSELDGVVRGLAAATNVRLAESRHNTEHRSNQLRFAATSILDVESRALRALTRAVAQGSKAACKGTVRDVQQSQQRLRRIRFDGRFRAEESKLINHFNRLAQSVETTSSDARRRMSNAEQLIHAYHPARTVERGFALVRNEAHHIVTSIERLKTGEAIDITLKDGVAKAVVTTISGEEEE